MTEHETVDYLLNHHCSLARFGDGKLAIAAYGCGIGFQEADPELQAARNEIIADDNPNILLCLPGRINYARKKRSSCSSGILAKRIAAPLPYVDKKIQQNPAI